MTIDTAGSVLVVDDYKTMVRIISNLLKQIGFTDIDGASDGDEAFEKIQYKAYNLIISDWNMEPVTGIELLRRVRAEPMISKTPFIMVTAESKAQNVIEAKRAGVSSYIVKPFNAQTLRLKIDAAMR